MNQNPDISRGKDDAATETIADDITINAVDEVIHRIQTHKPENRGARSAESALTSIMGRMAIDLNREVSWEEVLASA